MVELTQAQKDKVIAKALSKAENKVDYVSIDFSAIAACVAIDKKLRDGFKANQKVAEEHAAIHNPIVARMGPTMSDEVKARLHLDKDGKLEPGYRFTWGHRGGSAVASVPIAKPKAGAIKATA